MVHKTDFYGKLYMCVTNTVRPHQHRTTHCRKSGNGTIIVYPAHLENKEYQSCWPTEGDNRNQL